ncbi:MAG: OsmC family protein [Thermaerobacter sp.]|nr:OsmC family protein [Thermaerobacter sp.]
MAQTLKIAIQSRSPYGIKTEHTTRRQVKFRTDEPPAAGGEGSGPSPLEAALAALTGCLAVVVPLVAESMGFQHGALAFAAEGVFDRDGMLGVPGVRRHFQRVELDVAVETDEPQERLEQLALQVEDRCPVHNLFTAAGVEMRSVWHRA